MSLRRDGPGCLPLLAASALLLGLGAALTEGPHDVLSSALLILGVLLPAAYFISPKRPDESVIFTVGRAARFHRTVREQLGQGPKIPWWKPSSPRRPIPVLVGEDELALTARRVALRKYPDVRLDLDLGPDFPPGLSIDARGVLTRLTSQPLAVPGLDLALEGDPARLLALFDAPMRWQTVLHVERWRLSLSDGHLRAEVHGLDVKERGIEQVREFLRYAHSLRRAAAAPVGDRLLHNAKRDRDPPLRIANAEALWDLEPRSERANALRKAWLRRAHRADLRIAAARRSGEEGLTVLESLARSDDPEAAIAATRALGDLAPASLPILHALADLPLVADVVAEQRARHGIGGELALKSEGDGGELALSSAEGELALTDDDQDSVSRGIKSTKLQGRKRESN